MVIIEGPDGSGKTTLLRELSVEFPQIDVHARASDSVTGPVPDIFKWGAEDVETWSQQPLSFYDRHPLISEPIYGPICRNHLPHGFGTRRAEKAMQTFHRNGLLILCLPPLEVVLNNVLHEKQMAGVIENIAAIHAGYASLLRTWPLNGRLEVYDYRSARSRKRVISQIQNHLLDRKINNV